MAHSNQIREFVLTDKGVNLLDVYVGPSGVLTGSARLSGKLRKRRKIWSVSRMRRSNSFIWRKRKAMEAQIADIRAEFKTEEAEAKNFIKQEKMRERKVSQDREAMAQIRKAD
jgi:circadian clock protein KaiC